ncbi:MAG: phenylalanine--tRNA ligase subunit beta [Bacteroidota bacterium]|nr:phenylalanine--tRNA ligase subunit beta [Bacteroidota bacterium]
MKISLDWLNNYIDIEDIETSRLLENLTDIGLEVTGLESWQNIPGGLEGIVTGKITSCEKHPNADKLSLTKVDIGKESPLSIVCGAPNVAEGQTVPVATVGTTLHIDGKPFKIKKAKLRGEPSEGMICAEDEIGIGTSHEGIMVLPDDLPAGMPLNEYVDVTNDQIIEIDLTPNRIDAASHIGTARDLAARLNFEGIQKQLTRPDVSGFKVDNHNLEIPVAIENPEACKRYVSCTVSGITVKESPQWLKNRLKSIGLNPINNIVDITNFVLHETGHPMHAFDVSQITGNQVIVKKLTEGTRFTTLDDVERKLHHNDLMICNAESPMCIAGVLGGNESGVKEQTKAVFLESAWFDPAHVRTTARRHGISTDASYHYERGADPEMCIYALKRAALLIKEIAGGQISSDISDVYPVPITSAVVNLKFNYLNTMFGKNIPHEDIKKILKHLDIKITNENDKELEVEIPPYRYDVTRPADVAEEILRIYGFNNTPVADKLHTSVNTGHDEKNETLRQSVSDFLSARGFNEIMSNSLSNEAYYKNPEHYPPESMVHLANPGSRELGILRRDMLFSGLEAISRNINHKITDIRFYEFGKIYFKSGKQDENNPLNNYNEKEQLALWLSGNFHALHWNQKADVSNFYHLKTAVSSVFDHLGIDENTLQISSLNSDLFEYGLEYTFNKKPLMRMGLVKHKICKKLNIEQDVYFANVDKDALISCATAVEHKFTPLSKFPEVHRDLALLLDKSIDFADIKQAAFKTENKHLMSVDLFDVYEGKNIDEGKKSYALSFVLRDDKKTMTDKQIDKIMSKLIKTFKQKFGASLR